MIFLKLFMWNVLYWLKGYPQKGHCKYVFDRSGIMIVRGTYIQVAHAWAYDSTIENINDLAVFHTMSRTRAKQLLNKFMKSKTKKAP